MSGSSIKNRSITSTQRLKRDYLKILKDPVPYVSAHPLPDNILEWNYVIRGPEGTPYENGIYHGKLRFPADFPFKPPTILMLTPSGRFKCNTRLCLSISDFHPNTWNPTWSASTILTGLLSFMLEKNPTMGSIDTPDWKKRCLARESWAFNLNNNEFCQLFPELAEEARERIQKEQQQQSADALTSVSERVAGLRSSIGSTAAGLRAENGSLTGALTNIGVVIGFIAFVYTARYVLRALSAADHDPSS